MLEFHLSNGYTFFLNNLLTFICIVGAMCYFGWAFSNKKYDKALHFSISAAMTFVLLTLSHYAEINWWWAPISVLIIGLFKEAYDRIWGKKHLFDFNDLVADAVGIGGITLPFIFSFLLSK